MRLSFSTCSDFPLALSERARSRGEREAYDMPGERVAGPQQCQLRGEQSVEDCTF